MKLGLGLWSEEYSGIPPWLWLRWYNELGEWVLTEAEEERRRAKSRSDNRHGGRSASDQIAAQSNVNLMIGSVYTKHLGLKPADELEIGLGP